MIFSAQLIIINNYSGLILIISQKKTLIFSIVNKQADHVVHMDKEENLQILG